MTSTISPIQLSHHGIFRSEDFIRAVPSVNSTLNIRVESFARLSTDDVSLSISKDSEIVVDIFLENRSDPKHPIVITDTDNMRRTQKKIVLSEADALALLRLDEVSAPSRKSTTEKITEDRMLGINTRFYIKSLNNVLKMSEEYDQLASALPDQANPEYHRMLQAAFAKKPSDEILNIKVPEWQNKLRLVINKQFNDLIADPDFLQDIERRLTDTGAGGSDKESTEELLMEINDKFFGK